MKNKTNYVCNVCENRCEVTMDSFGKTPDACLFDNEREDAAKADWTVGSIDWRRKGSVMITNSELQDHLFIRDDMRLASVKSLVESAIEIVVVGGNLPICPKGGEIKKVRMEDVTEAK